MRELIIGFSEDGYVAWYDAPSWNKNIIAEELKGVPSVFIGVLNTAGVVANSVTWYEQNR